MQLHFCKNDKGIEKGRQTKFKVTIKKRMYPCGPRVYCAILEYVRVQMQKADTYPLIVGIQGVQGCGKSHSAEQIKILLGKQGTHVAVFSIDDFYLPRHAMGDAIRGRPGTHDTDLLKEVLRYLHERKFPVHVPIYDKTAHNGMGDRSSQSVTIDEAVQVVIVEGWCIGFAPIADPPTSMLAVNAHLHEYDAIFRKSLDCLVVLIASGHCAFEWRERAEANMRLRTGKGMNTETVREFVAHYQPVYDVYLKKLQSSSYLTETLHLDLDAQ